MGVYIMPSISIKELISSDKQVRSYFNEKHFTTVPAKLRKLFDIAMQDKNLFPKMNVPNTYTYQDFIDRWVKGYIDAENSPARDKTAAPKGSCSDPAIKTIVKMVTRATDEQVDIQEAYHNLFMSAENIQGALLEEYIDSVISAFGWIWCKGNTLHSVDFCTEDGAHLLQIKNKSNSENSSSGSVRSGTGIEKWYRLGTRSKGGVKIPYYKWAELNKIIQDTSGRPCNLSEADYIKYVEEIATNNPALITDK